MEHMQYHDEVVSWVLSFVRLVQDWELESVTSFLDLLYSNSTKGFVLDKVGWNGSSQKGFQVKSFYKALLPKYGLYLCLGRIFGSPKFPTGDIFCMDRCHGLHSHQGKP
jgi:hypothetical protein